MGNKAANNLVDIIRDIVLNELNKRDSTILCQVKNKKGENHFDVSVVPDEGITISNVLNPTSLDIKEGDYVYIFKIANQLNNSFIVSKIQPYADTTSVDNSSYDTTKDDLSNYIILPYIESTGTQWIDTGIKMSIGLNDFTCDFQLTESLEQEEAIFGNTHDTNRSNNMELIVFNDANFRFGVWIGTDGNGADIPLNNNRHIIQWEFSSALRSSTLSCDSVDYYRETRIGNECSTNFCLFSEGRSDSCSKCRIYSCQIKGRRTIDESARILRDFVPVLRKYDRKPGLYDKINKKFYVNKGTGEFNYILESN